MHPWQHSFSFPDSLTVVDSDGASDSTTASLTVNRAVDYPPVANAGPIQVITLPQNSITLFGNQSTDDHGIASYEWSLSPSSKGKVVEMQVGGSSFGLFLPKGMRAAGLGPHLKLFFFFILITKVRFVHRTFEFLKNPETLRGL